MIGNTLPKGLLYIFFIIAFGTAAAQDASGTFPKADRHDFTIDNKAAYLIIPEQPIPGNPWIWRARFPGWHTEADSLLVDAGFHLVYINTNDQYGSPKAVETWNKCYQHLRTEFQLAEKVALAGVSRGGLFVYNWAKRNPKKVACIYAEAPVCDFKSWPGGFGRGEGSAADWNKLKQEYGFEDDAAAQSYTDNPIDNLEALAKAKIPILHMIGLKDQIVPPDENTFPLVNKYIQLGGIATVVPCTEGEQSLRGHHFPIETPQLVADFIKYHSLAALPLDAAAYHQPRAGLKNAQIRFEREKTGRVAFLGGSITYNPGWRDSICTWLQQRFPETKFEFIAAGIPSMGSTPGAFRLERDVLSKGRIDLLFEEAAVNDATNGRSRGEQRKAMEGIVRHLRMENPLSDIVLLYFVDPDKIADYRAGRVPEVIQNHEEVAEHYALPSIHLAREVTDRIDHKEFSWEGDFKDLHPSPFGQGVYAHSMIRFLEKTFREPVAGDAVLVAHELPAKLEPYCYDQGQLIAIDQAKRPEGWTINPSWAPTDGTGTRANYTQVPMLIGESPGQALQLTFTGHTVGIAVAAGRDAGMIEYRIDGGAWQKQNLYTRWSHALHLPWYYTLASGLKDKKHQLEIRVSADKDGRSAGNTCRIRYFYAG